MNYKLIGQRNLRKYTEDGQSPTYAASIEAQNIVNALCDIEWSKTSEKDAIMTYHTEDVVDEVDGKKINGLDMNVLIRDKFDAALFCADHTGGQHRAYANAAVYHYELPDGTLPKLTKLTASVTSDPYNSMGARISILTNSTGVIPTNCNECRTGDAHADGVAPRTVAANGNWFPTMADCVFSATPGDGEYALPSGGLQLQKHLFVFVLMESYSTVRGNWLEGCSFIKNEISIETDAAIQGWTDGSTYDLSEPDGPWYCVYRHAVGNGEIEKLFHVPKGAKVLINNEGTEAVPSFFCVEHDSLKSVFGPITIHGLQLIQRNPADTKWVVVNGENCQFADPDILYSGFTAVQPTEDMLREVVRRGRFKNERIGVKFNASGSLVSLACWLTYYVIGGVSRQIEIGVLMDSETGEIVKMCAAVKEDEAKYFIRPRSSFEPIDFINSHYSTDSTGYLCQDEKGIVAREHFGNDGSVANGAVEVGSSRVGMIESCNAIFIGYGNALDCARIFAGSKVDFMDGDKLFNRIFVMNPILYTVTEQSPDSRKPISEVVHPVFGKNYNLALDEYRGLSAFVKNPLAYDSPYDTVLIAGEFTTVDGVRAENGWAILRMNQTVSDGVLTTDYVNVVPMMLPRMRCVHIRSAEIENTNLNSLVALGIIE